MTQNNVMPSHLTGTMAALWSELLAQAGTTPEAPVTVTDTTKFANLDLLQTVGGCTIEKVSEAEWRVKLAFETAPVADEPEIQAVSKPQKFAA